jgi:very-short-patch-repair endonuclease
MVVSMASGTTSFYWLIIIALSVAFVCSVLSRLKSNNTDDNGSLGENAWPVRINENMITNAERSFLGALKMACGDTYVICPKARLGDVVYIHKGTDAKLRQSIQNRINQKHVDFLLLDPKTLAPVLAIELDDKSHQSAAAQSRDLVKDKALKDAGLRMIRFPARATYTLSEIEAALTGNEAPSDSRPEQAEPALVPSVPDQTSPAVTSSSAQSPSDQTQFEAIPGTDQSTSQSNTVLCPKCNTPMVIRKASKGTKTGTTFFGCANYPHCRETLPIE